MIHFIWHVWSLWLAPQWAEVLQSVWTVNGWTSLPCICEIWIIMNSLYFSVYQDCHPVLLLSFTATKSSQKKFRRLKGEISNRLVAHDSSSLLLLPPQQWHNVAAIVAADVELCCSTLMWGISVTTSCFKCVPLLNCALERLSDPHKTPAVMETRVHGACMYGPAAPHQQWFWLFSCLERLHLR